MLPFLERLLGKQEVQSHVPPSIEGRLKEISSLLKRIYPSSVEVSDQQRVCLKANRAEVWHAFDIVSERSALRAVELVLDIEKGLGVHARKYFWESAPHHISKTLKKSDDQTRQAIYSYILSHAHKGDLAPFLLTHAEDIGHLLLSPQKSKDDTVLRLVLQHAHPHTEDILRTYQSYFQNLMDEESPIALTATKLLCRACRPNTTTSASASASLGSEKGRGITLDYIESARMYQINKLRQLIEKEYKNDSLCFKRLSTILQDLSALGLRKGDPITRLSQSVPNQDVSILLYHIDLNESNNESLYVAAKKNSSQQDANKLTIILASCDLDLAVKSFLTLGYPQKVKAALMDLATEFGWSKPDNKPKQNYRSNFECAAICPTSLPHQLHPSFQYVSQLTAGTERVNSMHEQSQQQTANYAPNIQQIGWNFLPLQ